MTPSSSAPADPSPKARRGVRGVLLKLLLAGASSFLAAEIAVRVLVGAPMPERLPILRVLPHETRGWEMVPGEDHYTYLEKVTVNSLGLRGPEVGHAGSGATRVLALGDSLIYGQGVADDQTVPAHLQRILDERAPGRYEVVNGGLRAYATHQELALLDDLGPQIEPGIVVVYWFWNDVHEPSIERSVQRYTRSEPVAFDTGAPMTGAVVWKWRLKQLARRSAAVMWAYDLWRASRSRKPAQDYLDAGMERFEVYARRFLERSRSQGFRLVYALLPEAGSLRAPHFATELDARAARILAELGIETIPLHPPMAEYAASQDELPILPYDGHYDGGANAVLAEATADALLAGADPP